MKRKTFIISAIIIAIIAVAYICNRNSGKDITFMTYNIHNAIGMDGKTDYKRIGEIIAYYNPEVIALQEVDSVTERSYGKDVLKILGKATGMHCTYARTMDYEGGAYGIGILSKEEPISVRRVQLPGQEEPRVVLIAEFNEYVFAATHLSLIEEDRISSAAIISREALKYDKPFFLAGDWNTNKNSTSYAAMEQEFIILNEPPMPTFPANEPNECLDYIALRKKAGHLITVSKNYTAEEKTASDHRPVVVDLSIRKTIIN